MKTFICKEVMFDAEAEISEDCFASPLRAVRMRTTAGAEGITLTVGDQRIQLSGEGYETTARHIIKCLEAVCSDQCEIPKDQP